MKKSIFVIFFWVCLYNNVVSSEIDCGKFKKYSSEYFNCKTEIIKNKTIALGKDFVEDTKKYQKKNYEKSKEQIGSTKKQIEKTKEKILKK